MKSTMSEDHNLGGQPGEQAANLWCLRITTWVDNPVNKLLETC